MYLSVITFRMGSFTFFYTYLLSRILVNDVTLYKFLKLVRIKIKLHFVTCVQVLKLLYYAENYYFFNRM